MPELKISERMSRQIKADDEGGTPSQGAVSLFGVLQRSRLAVPGVSDDLPGALRALEAAIKEDDAETIGAIGEALAELAHEVEAENDA